MMPTSAQERLNLLDRDLLLSPPLENEALEDIRQCWTLLASAHVASRPLSVHDVAMCERRLARALKALIGRTST